VSPAELAQALIDKAQPTCEDGAGVLCCCPACCAYCLQAAIHRAEEGEA
jgi:hypothetical protein